MDDAATATEQIDAVLARFDQAQVRIKSAERAVKGKGQFIRFDDSEIDVLLGTLEAAYREAADALADGRQIIKRVDHRDHLD